MPRFNKVTEKVFASIAETNGRKGAYDQFLNIDNELGLSQSKLLKQMKEKYKDITQECKDDIQALALIEEIIIQIRSKEVIDAELRLSLSRDYIYARSTFYRRENQINDIRVIAGKVSDFGDDLDALVNDPGFKLICKSKLQEAMDKEIETNVKNLNLVYSV